MVLSKANLEAQLHAENKDISSGKLKEDNPLDLSATFKSLCEACRRGDLKKCQEMISEGVNINARDPYDYTPLILASLCGHYETVQLLLESGALCERDTFQGERCLYNALNDNIRNLLLQYDYSKSADPLQPLASHVSSLLSRPTPATSDIVVSATSDSFYLHKFILAARSPYFRNKLAAAPETTTWKLPSTIPGPAFEIAARFIYLGEIPMDLGGLALSNSDEQEVLTGLDKLSRHLEMQELFDSIVEGGDRRIARQRQASEIEKGRNQLGEWFRENVLRHQVRVESSRANTVQWSADNAIYADVLLRADEDDFEEESDPKGGRRLGNGQTNGDTTSASLSAIPIGPQRSSRSPSRTRKSQHSVLFPAHRAMLLRSEFFAVMFSSPFREAEGKEYLHIISIDCSPAVLEVVLTFLYTEQADFGLDIAVDVLFAADLLLMDRLKSKAALVISTLGNGSLANSKEAFHGQSGSTTDGEKQEEEEPIDIYDILRAGWLTRVHRLEAFAARFFAYRLEDYIEKTEFADLVRESAGRIANREETDTIELLDDIRYYLSERFRLRFEDAGLEEMMEGNDETLNKAVSEAIAVEEVKPENVDRDGAEIAASATLPEESKTVQKETEHLTTGLVRTLDGKIAGDEFDSDSINYQLLLGKIDDLLEKLQLDA